MSKTNLLQTITSHSSEMAPIDAKEKLEQLFQLTTIQLDCSNLSSAQEKRDRIARGICRKKIAQEVSKNFKVVSSELFELKRAAKLLFPKEGEASFEILGVMPEDTPMREGKIEVRYTEIPLLASVKIGGWGDQETASLGSVEWPRTKGRRRARLEARIPVKTPQSLRSAAYVCMAEILDAIAMLHRDPITAPIASKLNCDPDLHAYWIPEVEHIYMTKEIVPPPGDPALILSWEGYHFLIGLWEEPENSQVSQLVKEFT